MALTYGVCEQKTAKVRRRYTERLSNVSVCICTPTKNQANTMSVTPHLLYCQVSMTPLQNYWYH